jgi:hypothetical protein
VVKLARLTSTVQDLHLRQLICLVQGLLFLHLRLLQVRLYLQGDTRAIFNCHADPTNLFGTKPAAAAATATRKLYVWLSPCMISICPAAPLGLSALGQPKNGDKPKEGMKSYRQTGFFPFILTFSTRRCHRFSGCPSAVSAQRKDCRRDSKQVVI